MLGHFAGAHVSGIICVLVVSQRIPTQPVYWFTRLQCSCGAFLIGKAATSKAFQASSRYGALGFRSKQRRQLIHLDIAFSWSRHVSAARSEQLIMQAAKVPFTWETPLFLPAPNPKRYSCGKSFDSKYHSYGNTRQRPCFKFKFFSSGKPWQLAK